MKTEMEVLNARFQWKHLMLMICIKTKSIQIHNQMRVAVMMVRCYEASLGVASVNHCCEMEAFLNKPVIGIYEVFFTLETILCSIPTCYKSIYLLGTYLPHSFLRLWCKNNY